MLLPGNPNCAKTDDFINGAGTILENFDDGIFIINTAREIVWANKSFETFFNKKGSRLIIGNNCFCLFDNCKSMCSKCPAEKIFSEDNTNQVGIIKKLLDGEEIVWKAIHFPLRDEYGIVSHSLIHLKDRTYETKLEEHLRSSDRLISVGKLAAGIAHEIRNPLGNITAAAQFFLSKYKASNEIKKYLKIILRNSERMNKVIKDLLNLAKPHEVTFTVGPVDKVIDNVFKLVKARLLKQHIQFFRRFSSHLPKVLLDEKILEEVFLNLLLNAIEAMPKGGKLTVTASAEHNNEQLAIIVADTGVGISEENINKIFEPFVTTKKDGTGFGLSFVQQVIDLHKGKIDVKSKPGNGTEVKIILPSYKENNL